MPDFCGYYSAMNDRNFYGHERFKNRLGITKSHVDTFFIPIVFHIFHQGSEENISDEQVHDALDLLNNNFNRSNRDTVDTPEVFREIAGKMNVQFKFARLDPDGNCINGINRLYHKVPFLASPDRHATYIHRLLPEWRSNKYLNVYVTDRVPRFIGFAQPPWFNTLYDGVFINDTWIGTIGTASVGGKTQEDVLTHEVGHWLNLDHVWGPTNDPNPEEGCIIDDGVDDTPIQQSATEEDCPVSPIYSCLNEPNGDNYSNFMDYTFCRNMFTKGQIDVMTRALMSPVGGRDNLWNNFNLRNTGLLDLSEDQCDLKPIADFAIEKNILYTCYPENYLQFADRSSGDNIRNVNWIIPGANPTISIDKNPIFSFDSSGIYTVKYIVSNTYGSDTITREVEIGVFPEKTYSISAGLLEDFEDNNSFDSFHKYDQADGDSRWKRVEVSSSNSNYCLMLKLFGKEHDEGEVGFISPIFDLSSIESGYLSFKVAYSKKDSIDTRGRQFFPYPGIGQLDIFGIYGCGREGGFIGMYEHDSLVTSNPVNSVEFFPSGNHIWKEIRIDLPDEFQGRDDAQFIFRFNRSKSTIFESSRVNDYNNLFIDDIMIGVDSTTTNTTSTIKDNQLSWKVYPNPSKYFVNIKMSQILSNTKFSLFDSRGITLKTWIFRDSAKSFVIDIEDVSSGVYFIKFENELGFSIKRIVINR